MSVEKLVDSTQLDADLTSVANAIRTKGGTSASLAFPADFVSAIAAIPSGGGYTTDEIAFGSISGNVVITGAGTIRKSAFEGCGSITSVTANAVSTINASAFANCRAMTSVSISNCTSIGNDAFYHCDALSSVTLPASGNITVGNNAFYQCWALNGVDFSNVITIGNNGFRDCWTKNCLFNPITINDSSFRDAEYFGVEYFPRLTTINGTYVFAGAYDTSNYCTVDCFVAPALTTMASSQVLSYCNCLVKIDIGNLTKIQNETFRADSNFNVLILRKSDGVTALNNINAFTDTPFASGKAGGTLYVPQSLISSYQSASNWSTILGYANNSIAAIEGSQYENYYADGTPVS